MKQFPVTPKTGLIEKQSIVLEGLASTLKALQAQLKDLKGQIISVEEKLRNKRQLIIYLQKRLYPPVIQNSSNLECGATFSASNQYGTCTVTVTGIVQKFHVGQWHELYEYTAKFKSLTKEFPDAVTFGQSPKVNATTARYFLPTMRGKWLNT